jgi:hypothetical protein
LLRRAGPEGLDPRDLPRYPVRHRLGRLEPLLAVVVPPAERGYPPFPLECTELGGLKRQGPDTLHEIVPVPLRNEIPLILQCRLG